MATRVACCWLTKLEAEVAQAGASTDTCVSVRAQCQWGLPWCMYVCQRHEGLRLHIVSSSQSIKKWRRCVSGELWPCSRSREGTQWWSYQLGLSASRRSRICVSMRPSHRWLFAPCTSRFCGQQRCRRRAPGCLLCSHHHRNFIRVVLAIGTSIILPMHAVKPLHICWYIPSMPPSWWTGRHGSCHLGNPRSMQRSAQQRVPTKKNTCQTYHFLCPKISYLGDIFGLHPTQ